MFKKINKQIEGFLTNKNLTNKELEKRKIIEKVWEKTIPKEAKKNIEIVKFSNNNLFVKAKNPVWKMEIEMQKETLKKKSTNNTPAY